MRYLVPNALTAASLMCAFASIVYSVEGQFVTAAWFVAYCVLLDKVDGFAARRLGAQSRFGEQFDSFSDLVAFGVAPATLVVALFTAREDLGLSSGPLRLALLAGAGLYLLATAGRLARFNVGPHGSDHFQGFPTTLCGGLLATFLLTCFKYGLAPEAFSDPRIPGLTIGAAPLLGFPAYLALLAFLMVSHLRMPKVGRRGSLPARLIEGSVIALSYLFAPLRIFPEFIFAAGLLLAVCGVLVGARARAHEHREHGEHREHASDEEESPADATAVPR